MQEMMKCKQRWHVLRSAILEAFEILVQELQVEDTEAYQEMIGMTCETFCKILTISTGSTE